MKTAEVAEALEVDPETVRTYVSLGYLTPRTRSGKRGRGQRMYFDEGEVQAFKKGDAAGAAAYRQMIADREAEQAGPKRRGRGRKAPA